jgi:hypothetical protein
MLNTILKIGLTIICSYIAKLAFAEYIAVHFMDKKPQHPFSSLEKVSAQLNGPLQQVDYEQQLLWIGAIALAVVGLLVLAWFVRKLYFVAVISSSLFVLSLVYRYFTA